MALEKENEADGTLEKNLALLSPALRDLVNSVDGEKLRNTVEVVKNSEGLPVCRFRRGGKCFGINSEKPAAEAERWYETVDDHGTGAIFLFGSGFGYPIFEIFKRKQPHTFVAVFEQDVCLFAAMLRCFDFTPILKTNMIRFFVGAPSRFARNFDRFRFSLQFTGCSYPSVAFAPEARRNFKKEYLEIHRFVFTQLSLNIFYLGNDHLDTLTGLKNILSNAGEIIKNPYVSCLKDKYKGFPAFIVANGPSLDKSMEQLKNIRGRGLVLSVESAILPLLKNGVKPDVLTVFERTRATYEFHFRDISYPDDIALLCAAIVDKDVLPSFKGPKIPVFRTGEAINMWVNAFIGDGSAVDAGINVSHLAAELAIYLGANPIILVGQNYAYGKDGVTHSRDSVYYEEKGRKARLDVQSRPVVYVEGSDGAPVPSNRFWVDFRLGLERKIAAHPDRLFINTTPGGAKIAGAEFEDLGKAIGRYCTQPLPYRVSRLIEESRDATALDERIQNLEKLIECVRMYARLFFLTSIETARGRLGCMEMLGLLRHKDFSQIGGPMQKTYQRNILTFNKLMSDSLMSSFFQQIFFAHYYEMNRLGLIDTQRKAQDIFEIHRRFFEHLNLIGRSVSVFLEDAANGLDAELSELRSVGKERTGNGWK